MPYKSSKFVIRPAGPNGNMNAAANALLVAAAALNLQGMHQQQHRK